MKRRILSIILSLAMVLSMMPAVTLTASAAETVTISTAAAFPPIRLSSPRPRAAKSILASR